MSITSRITGTPGSIEQCRIPDPAPSGRGFDRTRDVSAHFLIGRDAMILAMLQGKPCPIMACSHGWAGSMSAARGADASE